MEHYSCIFGPLSIKRAAAALVATLAWLALAAQLIGMLHAASSAGTSTRAVLISYVSFFTIQSNALVALLMSLVSLNRSQRSSLMRPDVLLAVAVYVAASGLIYHFYLYGFLKPRGLTAIADVLLHYVVPITYIVYCLSFEPKTIRWWHPFVWLAYPILYLFNVFAMGAWSGQYPYPLLNANLLSPHELRRNAIGFLMFCLAIGLALYIINRIASRLASRSGD